MMVFYLKMRFDFRTKKEKTVSSASLTGFSRNVDISNRSMVRGIERGNILLSSRNIKRNRAISKLSIVRGIEREKISIGRTSREKD